MKFSENWLRSWINPTLSTQELAHQLTMAGLEVDAIIPVAAEFSGVVVAEVLEVAPHPDADKLRICQVNSGGEQADQIVCGASNVRPGLKVPCAQVGARLPGIKIKKAKLRGASSSGMLCSASELGLAEQSDGLLELAADAPVGQDIRHYLALDDVSIEIGLTPNRGDCLSLRGLAREVSAILSQPYQAPEWTPVAITHTQQRAVTLEAPEACGYYSGRVIQGVDATAPSPLWLQEALRRSGVRSVSAIVDITNYVLLELGHPLHAFDLGTLAGDICVRQARYDEPLTLLDGQTIKLNDDALVIADNDKAIAFAGIMGGAETAVSDKTQDIFLEAAYFDPIALAGKARQHGLHTDSSHRFERGVDPYSVDQALERATQLIIDCVGGAAGPISRAEGQRPPRHHIHLQRHQIPRLLGIQLDDAQISASLEALACELSATEQGWDVLPPSYRFDLKEEIDLVEEVGRLFGYDNIPASLPLAQVALPQLSEQQASGDLAVDSLVARGYQEAITYSFVDTEILAKLTPDLTPKCLVNPIASDMSAMRTTLWAGLIKAAVHNQNRQHDRVRLFERGACFIQSDSGLEQPTRIAGLALGPVEPLQWASKVRNTDFYDVKADVEALLEATGYGDTLEFVAATHPALHPGQSAQIRLRQAAIGWIGSLHPGLLKALGLQQVPVVFELDEAAVNLRRPPEFAPLSKYPSIRRDIALILDEQVSAAALVQQIKQSAGQYLLDTQIFDVYTGSGVEPGKRSLAIALTLQDANATLTDEVIQATLAKVITDLEQQFSASLRD